MALIRPDWPAPPRVHALVTERGFGDMARGGPGRVAIREHVPSEPVWLRQVHGISVAKADVVRAQHDEPQADAAVALEKGTVCAITVADCMPVLLSNTAGTRVGIAHAGWRGLSGGVIEATVQAMEVAGAELIAWLGPAIGPLAYEVGDEVRDTFMARDVAAFSAFAATRPGHWLLDLYAVARQRLQACGVTQIAGGGLCTYRDARRFFSYRRDRSAERMAALIWLA